MEHTLAISLNGRYDRAASTDANIRFPPVVLVLDAMIVMLLFCYWKAARTYYLK